MESDKKLYGDKGIGERLKSEMAGMNMDQSELALKLSDITGEKIDRSLISKWISGDRAITKISHLKALCECFGVSADYLLFGIGHAASIDPDITAAMKCTGLSEDAISLLATISDDEAYYFPAFPRSWINSDELVKNRKTYPKSMIINRFLTSGFEEIIDELVTLYNSMLYANKIIENAQSFVSSPYSLESARHDMIFDVEFSRDRLRLNSLSFADKCLSASRKIIGYDEISEALSNIASELKQKRFEWRNSNGGRDNDL